MQKKHNKKLLSLILSTMLIVAMAFSMTACSGSNTEEPNVGSEVDVSDVSNAQNGVDVKGENDVQTDATVLGEGDIVFMFTIVDADGNEKAYEIHTDQSIVGDALLELGLIAGDTEEYGLYVKTVDGITVDYDTDGKYWAFYINEEYAMSGVDATDVVEGATYSFKVE